MTEPTPAASNQRSTQAPLLERLCAALRPDHRWFPLVVFLLALALGLLFGLSWMGMRRALPAPSAAPATALDPQHPPLPAPLAGDPSALPAPMPGAPNAAHIEPAPVAAQPDAAESTPGPVAVVPDATPSASGDSQPQIVERKQPDYPIEALRAQEEGEVRLRIALDALGNVEDIRVVQSSRSRALDNAAIEAARNWKFRPAIHDGQPTSGMVEVPVAFRLDEH
jgi:protein TonB